MDNVAAAPATPNAEATPATPAAWFDSFSPEAKHESLKKFKGPEDLAKSYLSLERMNGNSIRLPKEDAPDKDAAWNEVYKKLGRPEAADKYTHKKPDDLPPELDYDDTAPLQFAEVAYKAGMTQKQYEAAVAFHTKKNTDSYFEYQRKAKEHYIAAETELKQEWGEQGYKNNVEIAKRTLKTFADQKDMEMLEKSGAGNNPYLVRIMAKIGKMMLESKGVNGLVVEEEFYDKASAEKELTALYHNKDHKYNKAFLDAKDPKHDEAMLYFKRLMATGQ